LATKIDIYNGALGLLGARPLATLSDNRAERRALDAAYGPTFDFMIESGMWHFASVSNELTSSDTVATNFGYQYAYEKPDDYVRLIKIGDNERFIPTLEDYDEEGDFFLCDSQPIWVQYVSSSIEAGGDVGKWAASFATAFMDELAYRAGPQIASVPLQTKDWLEKKKKKSLWNARAKSAVNQMRGQLPECRLVRARAGTRYINAMRRTPYA